MFEIGEKIICVNAEPWVGAAGLYLPPDGIKEGVVYTVKAMASRSIDPTDPTDEPIVFLEEVINPCPYNGYRDVGYYAGRFRKLIKKTQSIEIFTRMTTKELV